MEVIIQKSRTVTSTIPGREKRFSFNLIVTVMLSQEEQSIVKKYKYNPCLISMHEVEKQLSQLDSSLDAIDAVKILSVKTRAQEHSKLLDLRNGYRFCVDNPLHLNVLQNIEHVIITELQNNVSRLRALEEWEGSKSIKL